MWNIRPDRELPLSTHLEELRSRLIISIVAVLAATVLGFVFSDALIGILKAPGGETSAHLYVFSPLDGFLVKWRVALLGGLALASPIWLYQLLSFVAPGLTESERRVVIPLIGAGSVLFALGVAFGYYLMYGMIGVLLALFGPQLTYFPSADAYISFVLFFLLSTGIAFELPVVLYALVRLRVISTALLRKQRRYFYFAMFVFAEVITPVSDPIVAPLTITLPLVLLYELTIFVARLGERQTERGLAAQRSSS